jgi:thiosulfate/3-mercaptopyruvate sulfurtransferase
MISMSHTTLIGTAELAAHLDDAGWVIFDCRHDLAKPDTGAQEYAKAHISGARFMHLDRDLSAPATGKNGRHPLPDPQAFMRALGAAGVNAGKQVVAYDDKTGVYAARLWWMLRWLGHENVAVLDGGYAKWTKEGRALTSAVPKAAPARFSGRPRAMSVDADDVLRSLGRPGRILVDARSAERYRGENETLDPVGGRIPGSINRFFRENLDASGCFKPAADLQRAARHAAAGRSRAFLRLRGVRLPQSACDGNCRPLRFQAVPGLLERVVQRSEPPDREGLIVEAYD